MNQHGPIFRSEAIRRYIDRQEATTYPELVLPNKPLWLWLALGFIVTLSFLALSARMERQVHSLTVRSMNNNDFLIPLSAEEGSLVAPGCMGAIRLNRGSVVSVRVTEVIS